MLLERYNHEDLYAYSKRMIDKIQSILYIENVEGTYKGVNLIATPYCTPYSIMKQYNEQIKFNNDLKYQQLLWCS